MKFNNFFRVSLVLQTLVGLGLFGVSMFIEYRVLQTFLAATIAGLALTVTLESGKAVAIVWHRYLSTQAGIYPTATRIASFAFRIGLLLLSLLSSLLFLANQLDRPQLEAVRQTDLAQLKADKNREIEDLNQRIQQQLDALQKRQQTQESQLAGDYARRIDRLEQQLHAEMSNVVKGQFKGPRYRELERRLNRLQQEQETELQKQANQHEQTFVALQDMLDRKFAKKREQLEKKYQQAYNTLLHKRYDNDERVHASYIVSFLSVARAIIPFQIEPMQFVFAFSLMISLLMELGILVAFDNLTVVLLPALQNQHHQDLETEILRTQVAAKTRQEDIRHSSALDRIIAAAERTSENAASVSKEI